MDITRTILKDSNGKEYEVVSAPTKIHVKKHIESLNNSLIKFKEQLDEKNKTIEIMAEYIERFMIEDRDELLKEICSKKGNKNCDDCYADQYMDCVDCIKEYFISKTKGE